MPIVLNRVLQFSLWILAAAGIQADDSTRESSSNMPSLDMLPAGSILTQVEIPRYDKHLRPKSLLEAKTLTVMSEDLIQGDHVTISLLGADGSLAMGVDFLKADYQYKAGLVSSQQETTIRGNRFQTVGQGLVTDWQTQQGFLQGPVLSQFQKSSEELNTEKTTQHLSTPSPTLNSAPHPPFEASSAPRLADMFHPTLLSSLTRTLLTTQLTYDPNQLSEEQTQTFRQLTASSQPQFESLHTETSQLLKQQDLRDQKIQNDISAFLSRVGATSFLAQISTDTSGSTNPSDKAKSLADKDAPKPTAKSKTKPHLSEVQCEGGMYFDVETGILCYLVDVRATGLTKDNYTLTCSKELKIYLDPQKLEEAKKKKNQDPEKEEKKTSNQNKVKESLNDIIALGDVILRGKDKKGQDIEIKAAKAHYSAAKEEVLLEGGALSIQQGNNIQRIKKPTPGAWIRIDQEGNLSTSKHAFIGIYQTNE